MIAALTVVLALGSAPAELDPPLRSELPPADYALQWSAPAGCPDAAAVEARIAALTAGRPEGEGTLEVEGTVSAFEGGFSLRLTTSLRGRTGTRELSARACDDLADSAALVVAVTLDPALSGSGADEPEPESTPDEDGVPDPEPTPEPAGPRSTPERHEAPAVEDRPAERTEPRPSLPRPGLLLRGGLGPELGALPGVTAALRL
ncbi:MAG: hypothetical protein KC501_40300, partial [Myxococcales bacterium]|nr:hypothetical protein [Myxococcales bacterium]